MIQKLRQLLTVRLELVILSITTAVAIIYFSWDIDSWRFSFVGDEWPFYVFAKEISEKNFLINPLSFKGVYFQNSVLVSFYQAVFLKMLGYTNFAWRISNIILIIPIAIFFFLWLEKSFNTCSALISTIILQCSFYLANFFKIGNIMPQSFTLFIICLYVASKFSNKPTKKTALLLGLLLGLSFYVYLGPLFPFLIWPYLLMSFKKNKKILTHFLFLLVPYLFLLLPALLDSAQWNGPAGKTVFHKEYEGYSQVIINVFHNFLLFYKNYDYLYNHFVAGPYLDVITRILAFIGIIIILIRIKKRGYLFLLLAYISTCVIIGITSPYSYAPTTRGLFFLPFGFAFAGLALYELSKKFRNKRLTLAPVILLFIFIINIYQSQIGVFKETGYTGTALIIKELQNIQIDFRDKKVILFLSNSNNYNYHNIYNMQEAYGLTKKKFEVYKGNQYLECALLTNSKVIFFRNDTGAQNIMNALSCPKNFNVVFQVISPSMVL